MSMDRRNKRWIPLWVAVLAFCGLASSALADGEHTKGLFLYNLAKYVTWPADSFSSDTSPIVIGIVGDAEFAASFDALVEGHKAQGRHIRVMELEPGQSAHGVHLVYFPNGELSQLRAQAKHFDDQPAIRVAESKRFARHGDIGFVMRNGRIMFYINGENSHRAGMKVSSKLMRLASGVE